MLIWLRSSLFFIGMAILMVVFFPLVLLLQPCSLIRRHRIISKNWTKAVIAWLRFTCGVDYQVIFKDKLPTTPAVIMSKHQSAWETLALQLIMPPHVWVMKRELLRIPLFGWELRLMGPIAIDRSSGASAQKQLMEQGRHRTAQGLWILVFPEGTRIAPGCRGQYKHGGARLACALNLPIVPIAHNAGEYWPKNSFRKYPGKITVVVGEAIYPNDIDPKALTRKVEAWIENEMHLLTNPAHTASNPSIPIE